MWEERQEGNRNLLRSTPESRYQKLYSGQNPKRETATTRAEPRSKSKTAKRSGHRFGGGVMYEMVGFILSRRGRNRGQELVINVIEIFRSKISNRAARGGETCVIVFKDRDDRPLRDTVFRRVRAFHVAPRLKRSHTSTRSGMRESRDMTYLRLVFRGRGLNKAEPIDDTKNVENVLYIRQLDSEGRECCPCPQSDSGHDSIASAEDDPGSSSVSGVTGKVARGDPEFVGDCACGTGDADCTLSGSSDRISNARDAWPVMRKTDDEQDNTTLLRPEVSLASAVLETLREATEEDYEDALEKDARMNMAEKVDTFTANLEESDPSIESTPKSFTIIINPTDTFQIKDIKTNAFQNQEYTNSDLKETNGDATDLSSEMTESHVKPEEDKSIKKTLGSSPKLNKNEEGFKINVLKELLRDLQSKRENKFKNMDVLRIDSLNKYNEGTSKTSDSNFVVSKNRINGKKNPSNIILDTPLVDGSLLGRNQFDISKVTEDEHNTKVSSNDDQEIAGTNTANVININNNEIQREINQNDFDYGSEDNNFTQLINLTVPRKNLEENVMSTFVNEKQSEIESIFNDDAVDTDVNFADNKEKETNFENRESQKDSIEIDDDQKDVQIMNFNSDDKIQNGHIQNDLYSSYPKSSSFDERKIMKMMENEADNENRETKRDNTEISQNDDKCLVSSNFSVTTEIKCKHKNEEKIFKSSFKDLQRNSNLLLNDDLKKEPQIQSNKLIEHMRSGDIFNKKTSEENETVNESSGTEEGLLQPNKIANGNTDIDDSENTSDLSYFKNVPKERIEKEINKMNSSENSKMQKSNQNNNSIENLTDEIPENAINNNTEKMVADASNSIRNVIVPPNPLFRNLGKQNVMEPLSSDLIIQPESLINKIRNKINMPPLINLGDLTLNKLELPSMEELRSKVNDALGLSSLQQPSKVELPIIKLPLLESTKAFSLLGEPQEKPVSSLNLDLFQLKPSRFKFSQPSLKEKVEKLHSYHLNIPLEQPIPVKPVAIKSTIRGNNGLIGATLSLQPEPVLKQKPLNTIKKSSSKQGSVRENETKPKKSLLTSKKSLYSSKKVEIDPKTVKVPKLRPQFLQSPSLLDPKLEETRRMKSSTVENKASGYMKPDYAIKNLGSLMKSNEVLGRENNGILQIQPSELRRNIFLFMPNVFQSSPENECNLKVPQSELQKRKLQFLDRSTPLNAQSKSDQAITTNEETDTRKLESVPDDLLKIKSFSPKLFRMATANSNQEVNKIAPDRIRNELEPVSFPKLTQAQPTANKAPLNKQVIDLDNEQNLKQSASNNNNGDNQIILYNNGKFVGILSSILAKLISIDKNLSEMNLKQRIFNPYVDEKRLNLPNIKSSARDPEAENPGILKKSNRPMLMNFNSMKRRKMNNIKSNEGDATTDSTTKNEVESPSPRKVLASSKQRPLKSKKTLKSSESEILEDELISISNTTTPKAVLLESPLLTKLKEAFDATTNKILENSSPKSLSPSDTSQKARTNDMDDASSESVRASVSENETMKQNVSYNCRIMCTNE